MNDSGCPPGAEAGMSCVVSTSARESSALGAVAATKPACSAAVAATCCSQQQRSGACRSSDDTSSAAPSWPGHVHTPACHHTSAAGYWSRPSRRWAEHCKRAVCGLGTAS